mmetsp:Transcript_17337/g.36215  ORF Transcript_17337/g.36215 Transcript_17337/m.36215 type:complete len:204 (+) Transcript_17337:794-1405(+)
MPRGRRSRRRWSTPASPSPTSSPTDYPAGRVVIRTRARRTTSQSSWSPLSPTCSCSPRRWVRCPSPPLRWSPTCRTATTTARATLAGRSRSGARRGSALLSISVSIGIRRSRRISCGPSARRPSASRLPSPLAARAVRLRSRWRTCPRQNRPLRWSAHEAPARPRRRYMGIFFGQFCALRLPPPPLGRVGPGDEGGYGEAAWI